MQVPAWQVSLVVQAFPSLQALPFDAVGFEQNPVDGLHVPAVWHWSEAVQVTAAPPHTPAAHASPVVQALPSLHGAPLAAEGLEQVPVAGLQVPAT